MKQHDEFIRDKDGFIQLIRRTAETSKNAKKSKKPSQNPYKKGSWKYLAYKILRKWKSSKSVSDFTFLKTEDIILYQNGKPKVKMSNKRFSKDVINKILAKDKNAYILIDATDGIFIRISLKSYLKFMEIDKLRIELRVRGQEDGEDEFFDIYEDNKTIDNISQLMSWINYYRQLVYGVMEVQAHCCWYTYVKYNVKTVALNQDGTTKAYKGDFNEFLADYEFNPLL